MDPWYSVVIPAASGLVAGAIASIVAPWVHWRIEKKRQRLEYRKEMLGRWRETLDGDAFDPLGLIDSAAYSEMRPHLHKNTLESIEEGNVHIRMGRGGDIIRNLVLDDLKHLESSWGLL